MTKRRHISKAMRNRIHADHGGICCFCGKYVDWPTDKMEISHHIPIAIGGEEVDVESNMAPAHYACHRKHTAEVDQTMIAKCRRVALKHQGKWRPSRNPVPGSERTKWRKPLNKNAVLRHPKPKETDT